MTPITRQMRYSPNIEITLVSRRTQKGSFFRIVSPTWTFEYTFILCLVFIRQFRGKRGMFGLVLQILKKLGQNYLIDSQSHSPLQVRLLFDILQNSKRCILLYLKVFDIFRKAGVSSTWFLKIKKESSVYQEELLFCVIQCICKMIQDVRLQVHLISLLGCITVQSLANNVFFLQFIQKIWPVFLNSTESCVYDNCGILHFYVWYREILISWGRSK